MSWTLREIADATARTLLAQLVRKQLLPVWSGFNPEDIGYASTQAAPGNVFGHVFPTTANGAGINTAIAALGGLPGTIHLLAGDWTIDTDVAIPSTAQLIVEHGARLVWSPAYPEGMVGTDEAHTAAGWAGEIAITFTSGYIAKWPTTGPIVFWPQSTGKADAIARVLSSVVGWGAVITVALPPASPGAWDEALTAIAVNSAPTFSIAGPLVAPDSQWLDFPGSFLTFPVGVEPNPLWWGGE